MICCGAQPEKFLILTAGSKPLDVVRYFYEPLTFYEAFTPDFAVTDISKLY